MATNGRNQSHLWVNDDDERKIKRSTLKMQHLEHHPQIIDKILEISPLCTSTVGFGDGPPHKEMINDCYNHSNKQTKQIELN